MFNLPDELDFEDDEPTRIKIISVGIFGDAYLQKIQPLNLEGVETLSIISDKSFDEVEDFLRESDVVLVLAKVGDKLAKKVSEHIRSLDLPITLGVVDSQYDDEFAENFDAFIVARPNEAAEQIASFVNLLKNDGLVPISFVDFQTIFAGLEKKNMLVAIGEGPNANAAAKKVIESIDYEDQISESTGVAFQICGASDRISMIEIGEVSTNIADASNDAEIVWGAQVNNGLGDTIYVTILAVGFSL